MLNKSVLETISQFYPKGISESQDNLRYHSSEEVINHKATLNQIYNFKHKEWKKLLDDLAEIGIVVFDFSTIPSYNSCFHAQIRKQNYVIVLLISAFFKSYNILAIDVAETPFVFWDSYPQDILAFCDILNDRVTKNYPDYIILPSDLLLMKVPGFSVQPFEVGEASVFHYIYTLLTQYNKYIFT